MTILTSLYIVLYIILTQFFGPRNLITAPMPPSIMLTGPEELEGLGSAGTDTEWVASSTWMKMERRRWVALSEQWRQPMK